MYVTEYKTMKGTTETELDLKINEAIHQGFQPFGNPYTPGPGYFYQAMVKEPTTKRRGSELHGS